MATLMREHLCLPIRSLTVRGWLLVGAAYGLVFLIIAEPLWRP